MKKEYINYIILTILIWLWCAQLYSQQDAQYTQYMYNTSAINPAYAGTRGAASAVALYRNQWAGIDGAPKTQVFAYHTPVGFNEKIGLGGNVINEKVGGLNETGITADMSYKLDFSYHGSLHLGMKAGLNLLNSDFSQLQVFNENDELLETPIDNRISPIIGLGVYFKTDSYYIGLSAPNILETKHFDQSSLSSTSDAVSVLSRERINYYLMGGYVFNLSETVKFKPAMLTKMVFGAPWQLDLSANFMINNKLVLGSSYRLGAAISLLTGYNIGNGVFLGLSYDRETTVLGNTNFNNGSFEFTLRYEPRKNKKRFLTPRFF